jgi:hypothetical protein
MDLNPISHYNPIIAPPLIKILDPPLVGLQRIARLHPLFVKRKKKEISDVLGFFLNWNVLVLKTNTANIKR